MYFIYDLLLSPSHLLEHIYLSDILGYDEYHINTLNWIGLIGIVLGSYFSYLYFAKYKLLGYRYITLIASVSITLYLLVFFFIIDYNLPKEMLFLPILLRRF